MKIGIITLVSDNYGNKYQNYAVEQLLSQFGEVETFGLDNLYHTPASVQMSAFQKLNPKYIHEVLMSRPMYQYDINCVDRGVFYNLFYVKKNSKKLLELRKERSQRFQEFTKKNLHISTKVLNRNNTTKGWTDGFDWFICGSDQIWNPGYETTSELAFCSFAPEKTICLSPSFGVSQIPEHRKANYGEWLKDIYKLSVREEAGRNIIRNLANRDAEVLLDPTMAVPIERWHSLCKKPKSKLPPKYIVCYFLGRIDKDYRKKINDFAKAKNLPIVMLFDITTPEYYLFDPAEVLYTIKHAEYVLTDSFHGTVFSILFHKNFLVFNRNEGGNSMNSRLETLLEFFKLQDSTNIDNKENVTDNIWQYVDKILEQERVHTKKYLEDAFRGVKERKTQHNNYLPNVYSGYCKDNDKLMDSASGGAATAFAEAIINKGGCVFGVEYTPDYKSAKYISCETIEDLKRIKGSKYFETKKNFAEIGKKLQEGRSVLFIGLGCDVAAVLAYCQNKQICTDNLYTIDIICHGPMASLAHQRFIEDLENKYKSKIVEFNSRSKKKGWSSSSYIKAKFYNGRVYEKLSDYTDYGYIFTHYALKHCTNCHFKGADHQGDLCVGDYWGINSNSPEWNKNGVSIIVVQTNKGNKMLDLLDENFVLHETDAQFAFEHNPMYVKSRRSIGDYNKLIEVLKKNSLHDTLRKIPDYNVWIRKTKKAQIKSVLLQVLRK